MTKANKEKTGSCLDGATLASMIDGTLAERRRIEAEEHLGDCEVCLGQLTSLQLLLTSIDGKTEQAPEWAKVKAKNLRKTGFEKKPVAQKGWVDRLAALIAPPQMRLAAVGVTACLAFFLFYTVQNNPVEKSPFGDTLRSGNESGQGLVLIQPDGGMMISRTEGGEFSWHDQDGADRYIVRIYREDGMVAWRGESTESRITFAGEEAARLLPGTSYEWSVEAVFPFSESIRSSLEPVIVR